MLHRHTTTDADLHAAENAAVSVLVLVLISSPTGAGRAGV